MSDGAHAGEQVLVGVQLGADKTGEWNAWYEWAVPAADDQYLDELKREGLI